MITRNDEKIWGAVAEKFLEAIANAEQTGKFVRPWKIELGKNISTGKYYSGSNAFRLMFAERVAPDWGTFNQWLKLGYVPGKATGVPVWSPPLGKRDEDGNIIMERPPRVYFVFNAADVKSKETGEDYPLEAVNPEPKIAEAEALFAPYQAMIESGSSAHYSTRHDTVIVPQFEQFINASEYYSVLAHELIHATGASHRLNRTSLIDYHKDRSARAYEELIAEFGASMICATLNIGDAVYESQLDYLADWAKFIADNPAVIKNAVGDAVTASRYLLNNKMVAESHAQDEVEE
jgi:antirestriction protein ArdC